MSELIESIDIVEYISQYVELEEKNGEYWGLSPFKDERTPSFSVREETQSFYDFSSGIGGNVFTFVKFINKCGSKKAIEILKTYVGTDADIKVNQKLASTKIIKKYKSEHKQTQSKREILAPDYMDRFEVYENKLRVWEDEGISRNTLMEFGVRYDSISNRLVYPIKDFSGNIINVAGRTLDENWKAKKLRKYTYFQPLGVLDTIYGLSDNKEEILKKREIIIFEGAKSVMLCHTWGILNTGAILTSHLNPNQLRILAKLGCRVVFALDKEVNIKLDHNIKKLKQFVNVEYIIDRHDLLDMKDSPVDKGKEVWERLYNERVVYR